MGRRRAFGWVLVLCAAVACGGPARTEDATAPPDPPPAPPEPPPPPPPVECQLRPAAFQWVLEGDPLMVRLTCASGAPVAGVTLDALPPGARFDAAEASIAWTPRLDQAGGYEIGVSLAGGEQGTVRIGVVDRFDARGNRPPDPATYHSEYGLPVVHLATAAPLDAVEFRPVTVTFRGRAWKAEAKVRGQSSRLYPKKGWNLVFPDGDRFDAPDLGLGQRKRIALIANFDDASHVRNRLSYELWKLLDPEHLWIRHASAAVYLDGEYHGLYTLTEKLAGQFLAANRLSGDGNLYEAVSYDADFKPKSPLWLGYEKQEGSPPQGASGAFADLEDLVGFVIGSDDRTFADELPRRVRLADYQAWWVFAMAALATDNVQKNNYHYHDPLGGPWRMITWDHNATFGQSWQTLRTSPRSRTTFADQNHLFERMLSHRELGPPLRARLAAAIRGPLAPEAVLAVVDRLVEETREGARRDETRWGAEFRSYMAEAHGRADFTTYEEEVRYLRRWISSRAAYLREAFPTP